MKTTFGRSLWLLALLAALVATLAGVVVTGYRLAVEPLDTGVPARTDPQTVVEAPPPAPAVEAPVFDAADARLSPEAALRELWAALDRGDARTAAKYLLDAKRRSLRSGDEVLAELSAVSAGGVEIVKVATAGDRAVLFATATSKGFTDAAGEYLGMDAVFRLLREGGHWKLHTQRWLVNTPPGPEQQAALAWLETPPGRDPAAQRLDALGLTADLEHFQSAVARNELDRVRLFLEAGLDPDVRPEGLFGQSLFALALLGLGEGDRDDLVLLMAGAGADLDTRTPSGLTPLMQAVLACRPRVVEGLLGQGVPRGVRDGYGRTAADWARTTCPAVAPLLEPEARERPTRP